MDTDILNFEISNNESLKLAENLTTLIKINKLSIQQIADELKIPVMTVRRLVSGNTTNPTLSTLRLFAARFNITIDSLIKDTLTDKDLTPENKVKDNHKSFFIPVMDWDTAEKISDLKDFNLVEWHEWQSLSFAHGIVSENSFALKSKPSMYSRFSSGTIFIIDPNATTADGDTLLIRIVRNNELTLRLLVIDSPDWELQSIIADGKSFKYIKSEHEIIGVVMLTMLFNKKLILQTNNNK